MKKSLKNLLLAVLLLASIITLSGCGKDKEEDTKKEDESNKDPIVGVWAYGSFKYTFNEDKTCSYDASGTLMKCTYKIDGDKLSILYEGDTEPFETTYSIKGDKLNIQDSFGDDTIYTKVK